MIKSVCGIFGCNPGLSPRRAMLHHPIKERPLEADVPPMLLTFIPLVTENFLPLCLKLPVEGGVLQQITCIAGCWVTRHYVKCKPFQRPKSIRATSLLHSGALASLIRE